MYTGNQFCNWLVAYPVAMAAQESTASQFCLIFNVVYCSHSHITFAINRPYVSSGTDIFHFCQICLQILLHMLKVFIQSAPKRFSAHYCHSRVDACYHLPKCRFLDCGKWTHFLYNVIQNQFICCMLWNSQLATMMSGVTFCCLTAVSHQGALDFCRRWSVVAGDYWKKASSNRLLVMTELMT